MNDDDIKRKCGICFLSLFNNGSMIVRDGNIKSCVVSLQTYMEVHTLGEEVKTTLMAMMIRNKFVGSY